MNTWNRTLISSLAGGLLLSAAPAFATPAVETSCKKVKHPSTGSSVLFDDSCNTAYVLPPTVGRAQATAAAPTANIQFCPSVMQTHKVTESTTNSARVIAEKILQMISDFSPLEGEIEDLRDKLAIAGTEKQRTDDEFSAAKTRKTELVDAVAEARSSYDTCTILNAPESCVAQLTALDAAKEELRTFLTVDFLAAQRAASAAKAEFDRLADEYASRTSQLAEGLEPLFALQGKLYELEAKILDVYEKYTKMEGASVQLTYSIPWEDLIRSYQNLNPGRTFQRLPILDGQFDAQALINDDVSAVPAVLSYAIPGMPAQGPRHLPSGKGLIKLLSAAPTPASAPNAVSIAFGGSVSAGLLTSLLGACPFFPDGNTKPKNLDEFTSRVIANASYAYEVTAKRGYTARYNLSSWISRVEKKVKKGGFFSSKVIHEVHEDADSNDWFEIKFDSEKREFQYTPQEQENITKEVKGQLMERALRLLALQNGSLPGAAKAGALPPTGAGVAAGYLLQGCGYWSWCAAGGFVLGTLDSIFGSSQAIANFKKDNNVWVTDKVVGKAVLLQTGRLTFQKL